MKAYPIWCRPSSLSTGGWVRINTFRAANQAVPVAYSRMDEPISKNFCAAFELGRHEWFAHFGVSEVLYFTKSHKWTKQRRKKWTTGILLRKTMCFEDLQRCGNSRRLTDGSVHNRNNNFPMWPDKILTILCYFLAAIHSVKVTLYVHKIKHLFTYLLKNRILPKH